MTIRLPQWMISQLKSNGEIGYLIENQLAKKDFLDLPDDYEIDYPYPSKGYGLSISQKSNAIETEVRIRLTIRSEKSQACETPVILGRPGFHMPFPTTKV